MRDYNERLVLSLVRQHGALAKKDIARMTGLSAQTISVIMRELEADALLVRGEPIRGKVGQPSIPMSLNPEGAFFLGLKIGRRSADLVLIDFLGTVRGMIRNTYLYPVPKETVAFVKAGIASLRGALQPAQRDRIAGLGIAMPFELWNWADTVAAERHVMDEWRTTDIRAAIAADWPFPIYLQNDATSACGAELVFGQTGNMRNFIYFYVGAFVGGGVVLDGALYTGATGNAGALGSMPVPDASGRPVQLIDIASIAMLERSLIAAGRESALLWTSPDDWGDLGSYLDDWIEQAAAGLAYATVAASAVIDFEAAVIDGWMPQSVRKRLVERVTARIGTFDAEGIALPETREGTVGIHARALGGASLPLSDRFLLGPGAPGIGR
ncbi:MAG: ROK family transcriptional regulator [Mesorhizobium sp.]|nr:ROK family transcriptional regulator [Mesorhizobium sp.]